MHSYGLATFYIIIHVTIIVLQTIQHCNSVFRVITVVPNAELPKDIGKNQMIPEMRNY